MVRRNPAPSASAAMLGLKRDQFSGTSISIGHRVADGAISASGGA
jgi:hypothetical protein